MIRFLINFVLFGLLFFLIYRFFPDAFTTLVAWVGVVYEFLYDLGSSAIEQLQGFIRRN